MVSTLTESVAAVIASGMGSSDSSATSRKSRKVARLASPSSGANSAHTPMNPLRFSCMAGALREEGAIAHRLCELLEPPRDERAELRQQAQELLDARSCFVGHAVDLLCVFE